MKIGYLKRHPLPDSPGVYIFRDTKKRPLYIGRATSLRDRVRSYFGADLIDTRGPRLVDMITKAVSITHHETVSVLEAILLESELIKKYQPHYNVDERDDKSDQYVVITKEEWPRVFLVRVRDFNEAVTTGTLDFEPKTVFGPFLESGLIKEALKILRRLFPFRDLKANDPRHEAFYLAIGRSPEKESSDARKSYAKTIKYLSLFFEGESDRVRNMVERDMKKAAREFRFEDAAESRKLLYALNHINDISLVKERGKDRLVPGADRPFRIEAYDIAHLSGTNVVGAMVVSHSGEFAKESYRKFKVTHEKNDDIAGMVEILSRRLNHQEWQYPDLIVVDGDERHQRAAQSVLKARRIGIPVVAVRKDDSHKAAEIIGAEAFAKLHEKEIVALNAECHRFVIAYHRQKRGNSFRIAK